MEPQILDQIDPRVLGQRLLEARRAAGFTQQAVADQMDMARTTVVAIEKGERRVTAPELIRFAQAYNRSVSDFVGRQTVTQGFVTQFRSAERQVLETNSEYEQVALDLQRRSEDYVELERLVGTPLARAYPAEYKPTGGSIDQMASDHAADGSDGAWAGRRTHWKSPRTYRGGISLRIFFFCNALQG